MQQLLHTIAQEFQNFKKNPKMSEIYLPTLNGNTNLGGFNTFLASLWANNQNLSGDYTTSSFIENNDLKLKANAPKIFFLDYYWSNTMVFIAQDVQKYLPNFEISDENIQLLKRLFQEEKINSFSVQQKEEVKKDFGEIYEINFGKSVLNYKKIEVVPNEFVIGLEQKKVKDLSQEKIQMKEKIENEWYYNFDEVLQHFYFLLMTFGSANMKMFQHFELYELNLDTDFLIKTDNNFILSKQIKLNLFNQIKSI